MASMKVNFFRVILENWARENLMLGDGQNNDLMQVRQLDCQIVSPLGK